MTCSTCQLISRYTVALLLLTGFTLPSFQLASHAKKKNQSASQQVAPSFLPPMATINEAHPPVLRGDNTLSEVGLSLESHSSRSTLDKVTLTDPVSRLEGHLPETQPVKVGLADTDLQQLQQALEEEEMATLWEATVERNPVVRFSLEKLALPTELRDKHSSRFLKKTLNVMISGAAIGATMLTGGAGYQDLGIMAASSAVQNLTQGKRKVASGLSATEQIQLAEMIESLRKELINSYHTYVTNLQSLAQTQQRTEMANQAYSDALQKKDPLAQMSRAAAYYQALQDETEQKQQAKLARLQLERLAGVDPVRKLHWNVAIQLGSLQDDQVADDAVPSLNDMPSKTGDIALANPTTQQADEPSVDAVTEALQANTQRFSETVSKPSNQLVLQASPAVGAAAPFAAPSKATVNPDAAPSVRKTPRKRKATPPVLTNLFQNPLDDTLLIDGGF